MRVEVGDKEVGRLQSNACGLGEGHVESSTSLLAPPKLGGHLPASTG